VLRNLQLPSLIVIPLIVLVGLELLLLQTKMPLQQVELPLVMRKLRWVVLRLRSLPISRRTQKGQLQIIKRALIPRQLILDLSLGLRTIPIPRLVYRLLTFSLLFLL
jgi:hypothetical protein